MSIAKIAATEKEPPGRGLASRGELVGNYQLQKIILPTDHAERLSYIKDNYAFFIHNAYTNYPLDSESQLADHKREIAAMGLAEAEQLVEARENGELVGVLAYTDYTRETHPEKFEALSETNKHIARRQRRVEFQGLDDQIEHIVHIAELAVRKDKRGNGVSPAMREVMTGGVRGQLVMEIGEIQSASPLKQRLKLPGPTYFAGRLLNLTEDNLPTGFSIDEMKAYVHTKGYLYADTQPHSGYDRNGIIESSLFELPASMPERLPLSMDEQQAMQTIMDRQRKTGKICSAVAVTLYRP